MLFTKNSKLKTIATYCVLLVASYLLSACSSEVDNTALNDSQEKLAPDLIIKAQNDINPAVEIPKIYTPYQGSKAQIIGSYNLGCIDGAVELSDKGKTFQIQRYASDRAYAHPLMIEYLNDLFERAHAVKLPPLIIGDISRPYGGPLGINSAHASHQIGLDVDIPFDFALPRKSSKELSNPIDNYIVNGKQVLPSFTKSVELLIKVAASDPRVDRVFVAPMIKKHMCILYQGTKQNDEFLRKLRPWFGHRAHMHVRLACPTDSPDCRIQTAVPAGNGCGYEVDSWFLPPPAHNTTKAKSSIKKKKKPVMPQKCIPILKKYSLKRS